MTEESTGEVPFWTLATRAAEVPAVLDGPVMTPERLGELRSILATLADVPLATLEAHPLPGDLDRTRGLHLEAASPLATHLSQLVARTPKAAATVGSGAVLYRMVVPAKVAQQVGSGLVGSMAAKGGGVYSALRGSSGIVGQARFVPVAAGAAGGSAGTAGIAAAGAGVLTVAAPLVLMAITVGVSVHAENQRREAIERIAEQLKKLTDDALRRERSALNGCRDAIEKATAILLDQGRIGVSLGLDAAVYAINTGIADAEERLKHWHESLTKFGDRPVELHQLRKAFVDIDKQHGEFRAHLELAALAIAMKKRVNVLQAVEHAQLDPGNTFENFIRALQADQRRVTELESGITDVLNGLATLKLDRKHGIRDKFFTPGEVDELLRASYALRELGPGAADATARDVAIEIARESDGSVVVFPAGAVAS